MPGVIALLENAAVGTVIADILLVVLCATPEEMEGRILYVPF